MVVAGNAQMAPPDMILFLLVASVVALTVVAWMLVLMYRAFAVSCNVGKAKAIIVFIVAVLLGEVLSKIILVAMLIGAGGAQSQASAPVQEGEVTASAAGVVSEAKDFVDMLAKGDFVAATSKFDATMVGAMPPSVLEQTWNGVVAQAGPFKQQTGTRTATIQGFDTVYVTCQFERAPVTFKVVFNGSGQIAGLWLE